MADADCVGLVEIPPNRQAVARNGSEELCSYLNSFFAILAEIVRCHHGDILKFAGDAVTVAWFLDRDCDDSLPAMVALAAQCAVVLQVCLAPRGDVGGSVLINGRRRTAWTAF